MVRRSWHRGPTSRWSSPAVWIKSAIKAARFCVSATLSNIPVVTFVDARRASCRGTFQEYGGIIKHGAKLLYAYAECTVPKVTVITRRPTAARMTWRPSTPARRRELAWPSAEIAVII